jgi:hypothetical protein
MAVFLKEAQTGAARDLIGFPHLLVCMGVVLQTKAFLYGCHFDRPAHTEGLANAFAAYMRKSWGDPQNGVRLYGIGNWKVRYDNGGRKAWQAEMEQIAKALGYTGPVSGFDTGIIAPRDGTYVEFRPEYDRQRCRLFYKRNEKMSYTTKHIAGNEIKGTGFAAYERRGEETEMVETRGLVDVVTEAAVSSNSKKGLHEVDYFLRLVSFNAG